MKEIERDLKQRHTEVFAEIPTLTKSNGSVEHVLLKIKKQLIHMTLKQEESWALVERRGKIWQDE